jgi:hypothetical protein
MILAFEEACIDVRMNRLTIMGISSKGKYRE